MLYATAIVLVVHWTPLDHHRQLHIARLRGSARPRLGDQPTSGFHQILSPMSSRSTYSQTHCQQQVRCYPSLSTQICQLPVFLSLVIYEASYSLSIKLITS